MTGGEFIYLLGVIAAFAAFSVCLAWASMNSGGAPK